MNTISLFINRTGTRKGKPQGGYDKLHGATEADGTLHTDNQIKAAYTLAMAMNTGLVAVHGDKVAVTGKEIDREDIEYLIGTTAPRYWVETHLADRRFSTTGETWSINADGASLLCERLQGRSRRHQYNTTRRALQLVASFIRNGKGPVDIGFNPVAVKVKIS